MIIRQSHIGMVGALARSFNKTTGIEYNELFAEAVFHYCQLLHTNVIDFKRPHARTLIYVSVYNGLLNFCKNELKHRYHKSTVSYTELRTKQHTPDYFVWDLPTLPTPIRTTLKYIFENQSKLSKDGCSKTRLMHQLTKKYHWPYKLVLQVFKDIDKLF